MLPLQAPPIYSLDSRRLEFMASHLPEYTSSTTRHNMHLSTDSKNNQILKLRLGAAGNFNALMKMILTKTPVPVIYKQNITISCTLS